MANYPDRPLRFIIPEVPGSATDVVVRALARELSEKLGQPVEVERIFNTAALEEGAKAPPDGYTIVGGSGATTVVAMQIDPELPYDPFEDLLPVTLYARMPMLLCVHPSVPAKSVEELIALLKMHPHDYRMASAGVGQGSHLAGALFCAMLNVHPPHVACEGGGPSIKAVVDNDAQWTITPMASTMLHLKAGKLRALAVGSATRSPALPELPTIAEAGLPGYVATFWGGVFVPKGTPKPIINKLNAAFAAALADPDLKHQYLMRGAEAVSSTPAELTQLMREQYDQMGKVLRLAEVLKD